MKKLFLVMAFGGLGLAAAQAQTAPATTTPAATAPAANAPQVARPAMQAPMTADQVPDAVKNKFATDYPGVKDARWRKMGPNYQAYFKDNNNSGNVMYGPTGTLLRAMRQVDVSTLPQAATDYLAKNNTAGQPPVKTAMEIKEGNGNVRYQVMANGKGLSFDSKGNLMAQPNMPATTKPATPAPTTPK